MSTAEDAHEPGVRVRAAVLCDQVREEDNGKHFLIGVYDQGLGASTVPELISVFLYGVFETLVDDIRSVEFKVEVFGTRGIGRLAINENVPAGSCLPFKLPLTFILEHPGELLLDWRSNEGEWAARPLRWALAIPETAQRLPPETAELMKSSYRNLRSLPNTPGGAGSPHSDQPLQTN